MFSNDTYSTLFVATPFDEYTRFMEMILSLIQDHVFGSFCSFCCRPQEANFCALFGPKTQGNDAFFSNTTHVATCSQGLFEPAGATKCSGPKGKAACIALLARPEFHTNSADQGDCVKRGQVSVTHNRRRQTAWLGCRMVRSSGPNSCRTSL